MQISFYQIWCGVQTIAPDVQISTPHPVTSFSSMFESYFLG